MVTFTTPVVGTSPRKLEPFRPAPVSGRTSGSTSRSMCSRGTGPSHASPPSDVSAASSPTGRPPKRTTPSTRRSIPRWKTTRSSSSSPSRRSGSSPRPVRRAPPRAALKARSSLSRSPATAHIGVSWRVGYLLDATSLPATTTCGGVRASPRRPCRRGDSFACRPGAGARRVRSRGATCGNPALSPIRRLRRPPGRSAGGRATRRP